MASSSSSKRLSKTAAISAIFFDLDNTLIKTRKGDKLACDKLMGILHEQYNVPSDVATLATQTFLRNFRLCPDNGEMSLSDWRHLLWSKALGDKYAKIAGEVSLQWLQLRYHYLTITPEVSSLLYKLKKHYLLGLITNGPSCAQWEKVKRLDLHQYFDCILVSGDLPWEKPDRNIFLEACHYLGVEPRNCLMVGDKLETDIQGGKDALLGGTVWIPLTGENLRLTEHGPFPDFTLDNVIDLPHLLPAHPKLPRINRSRPGSLSQFMQPQNRCIRPVPDLEDCNSNSSDGS